jgi:hypothetical protein
MNKQPYLEGLRLHAQRAVESGKSCEQWVSELLPMWREEGRKAYAAASVRGAFHYMYETEKN